jgi:replication factor A1
MTNNGCSEERGYVMEEDKLAPHVQEIARALGNKLSEEEIEAELRSYVDKYKLSIPVAKKTIVKKHGGDTTDFSAGFQRKLGELRPNEPNVDFVARVITANDKIIDARGEKKKIVYGLLGDESTTLPYTVWEPEGLELDKGDVISVKGAYTKEYKGRVEVHLGNRVTVHKEDPATIEASEVAQGPPRVVTIGQIRDSMGFVEVKARILSVETREVTVQGEGKTIFSGTLADESGKIQYTAWSDFKLEPGELLKISKATVKSWRGIPQLNFDERADVLRLKEKFPTVEELRKTCITPLSDVAGRGGAADVSVRGTIIEVRDGSGLIMRCPECKRALQKGACKIHGRVEGYPDLRIKAVIDDGTGSVSAILGRELTEKLMGFSLEECMDRARQAMNFDVIKDSMDDALMFKIIDASGNVTADTYGLSMIIKEAELKVPETRQEIEKLLVELEESR